MLNVIKERLRPVFIKKFREARSHAKTACVLSGMSEEQAEVYLEGFDQGWLRGAVDSAAVKPSDLHPARARPKKVSPSGVH